MGNQIIYSSTPATDVCSESGKHLDVVYAVASVQGWRKKQEDAYKIIIDFHNGLSYFAVFDGHGGSEIAEFLKIQLHNYIKGFLLECDDIELALHSGFLSCDSSLKEPEAKAILNAMIENEDDAATRILKSHLLEVLGSGPDAAGPSLETIRNRLSDITARRLHSIGPDGDKPSITRPHGEGPSGPGGDGSIANPGGDECIGAGDGPSGSGGVPSSSGGEPSGSGGEPIGSGGEPSGSGGVPSGSGGEPSSSGAGASAAGAGPSGSDLGPYGDGPGPSRDPLLRQGAEDVEPIQYLLNEDLESSDSEDADFDVEDEESSSESTDEEMPVDAESLLTQEPGDLSGSTATIVLLSKYKIFVANVGDTKCVLSRGGQAIDMSLDHSPHNPEELLRIKNAGGSVSADGRVNNLINLSRAFGDFKLKGSSNIPAEQPITAEPYIKSINIEKNDEFVVIASDGIWNSISSQGLVDYINLRIRAGDCTLNTISEEIFKFIMPPKLSDDGTGCDNMTLLIIKLNTGESGFLIEDPCQTMEVVSSAESETDCDEEAPTEEIIYHQEQPSSSTEVGTIYNVVKLVPSGVDSTSNEVDSTSTIHQQAPLRQIPLINLVDQREIEVVDLDP